MDDDTRAWMDDLAERWSGGKFERCEVGHTTHRTKLFDVPPWFDQPIYGFDWQVYDGTPGYCSGNDEVSKSFDINQSWERSASKWMVEFLSDKPGLVLDVGSHVGWYSLLAATHDCDVLSLDASGEHLSTLKANAVRLGVRDRITTCRGWVSDLTVVAVLPPDGVQIRVAKADIESLEDQFVRIIQPLLEARRIDAVLMEVSPVFADHYPKTCAFVADCGYDVWLVPAAFGDAFQEIQRDELEAFTQTFDQQDYLFVLKDTEL